MRKMKDSGVEWIGEIPEEWEISKLKYLGQYINGYAFKPEDWGNHGRRIIRIQDLTGSNDNPNYYYGDIDDKYVIRQGDILISWAATLDAFIWDKEEALLNQHIFRAKPYLESIDYNFFFWMIKEAMENMTNDNKHGIFMQHVTLGIFGNYTIPLPSIDEQRKIAKYLDSKCSKINAIIAKQEQIIEKLKEYKLSLITEAVTKGLDPNVEMKDSGTEWLGKYPAHWQYIALKNVLTERMEKNDPIKTDERLSLSIDKGVTLYADKTTNLDRYKDDVSQYKLAYEGDLVLNSMNMIVGAIGISKWFGCVSPAYYTYYDNKKDHITAKYCDYLLRCKTMRKVLFSLGKGIMAIDRGDDRINTCRLKVSRTDLRSLKLPVPPEDEQRRIVDYLKEKEAIIDKTISDRERCINQIKEYKKSLIYEVVTGKKEI